MKVRLRDGTGTIELKYLVEDVDRHGNVRVYVRRHGRKVRIRETPGTNEFMAGLREGAKGFILAEITSEPTVVLLKDRQGEAAWIVDVGGICRIAKELA